MPSPSRARVDRRIAYLNTLGLGLSLDKDATGYRIENNNRSHNLSPRLKSISQVVDWLEAFETGYEAGKEADINSMRKGREEGW